MTPTATVRRADTVRVVVVDDVGPLREAMGELLGEVDGIEVVGYAGDGAEAIEAVDRHQPAVVLMDVRMPTVDGIEAARAINARHPEVAILMLSAYGDESLVIEALLAGASGYLLKDAPADQIADAVIAIAAGTPRFSDELTAMLLRRVCEMLGRERETRRDSEEAAAAAEELRARQQRFSTMAAHELRTPVTGILGTLVTLQRLMRVSGTELEQAELLTRAVRQAHRLARLSNDLLVLTQDARDVEVHLGPVDVTATIDEVAAELDAVGSIAYVGPRPVEAWADPDRLTQVLTNVIRNALEHGVGPRPIEVRAARNADRVEIEVRDHGAGIPPDRLDDLFRRFGDQGTASRGLGVGLWIVRALVEAMGGVVHAHNAPDGGAVFTVELPAAPGGR